MTRNYQFLKNRRKKNNENRKKTKNEFKRQGSEWKKTRERKIKNKNRKPTFNQTYILLMLL